MNAKSFAATSLLFGLIFALALPAFAQRGNGNRYGGRKMGQSQRRSDVAVVALSIEIRQSLLHMREEEKLARDVYLTLGKKYDSAVFSQIASAESRHMAAMKRLLNSYGLSDPVINDSIGKFTKPEFARLYNELVAQGSESLADAYEVGALIEELDIADLNSGAKLVADRTDIGRIYQNLTRASRNHLRAFASQLDAQGKEYTAQHLSQKTFEEIANSPWERGRRRSR